MANITLDDVTKRYRDTLAVDSFNATINDGEFLVLVGPSGCGKTTTLRCIAGLEKPTEGEIRFDGELQNHREPQDRNIAMVFQDYALYPHMTVEGNMLFGLEEEEGYTESEREERVADIASMLDIEDLLDRKPDELSGGQQQRVALGRAIVRQPEVFLLDEPLANLDAKLRAQMRTELQHLQENLGVTTVYVTHDQTEAMTMGDRIAVMNDGVLQQIGEPLELYHQPANRFVAGFLGEPTMNFFSGEYEDGVFIGERFEYRLDADIAETVKNATGLTLGVRPADIELRNYTEDRDLDDDEFVMVVTVVEPMGDQNVVHLRFPEDDEEHGALTVETDEFWDIEQGQDIVVRFPMDAIHLFEDSSGEALHNRRLESAEGGKSYRASPEAVAAVPLVSN